MRVRSLVLSAVLAAISLVFLAGESPATADAFSTGVDADASGNTATSLGTIDPCRSVSTGASFDVDVWVQSMPQFIGVQYDLYYDPSVMRVTGASTSFIVVSSPGAGPLFDVSELTPDADGVFTFAAVDLGAVGGSGSGVLARITLEAVAPGSSPLGLASGLLVDSLGAEMGDGPDDGSYVDAVAAGAIVWVGEACPSGGNDADADGVDDATDNCLSGGNPDQGDRDGDGAGNWCDDGDGDGRLDVIDNCPNLSAWSTLDADGDGLGDECDSDRDGDGVPNASDNVPNIPNADQADTDGDTVPDVIDLDVDGDGVADKTLVLSATADIDGDGDSETVRKTTMLLWNGMWEGYVDGDADTDEVQVHVFALPGSMQTADLDGDGEAEVVIKDPGQPPAVQQSYDLMKDDPDTDADVVVVGGGGLGLLVPAPADVDSDGEVESLVWEPELAEGAQVNADLDGDSDPDIRWQNAQAAGIDNCPALVNPGQANNDADAYGDACDVDDDNDGYADTAEAHIGTGGFTPCGTSGWPADLTAAGGFSLNRVNISDLASFVGVPRYLNTNVGTNPGDIRWDVVPGSAFGNHINISDMQNVLYGTAPMLGGARMYNGPSCPG